MAVLGFHLVITLIALTIFSKLKSRLSFCHFLVLKGLYYFLPPTQDQLRTIVEKKYNEKKKRQRYNDNDIFNVPKDTPIQLIKLPLTPVDLNGIPFFDTLCFVFDYLIFALIVFTLSEIFIYFFPSNRDTNVSIIWLFIAAAFMLHGLAKLTASNIGSPELTAERNLIFCFCAISFLFCTVFTMSCDKYMDIQFTEGYKNFTQIIGNFMKEQKIYAISNYENKSPILLYLFLSTMFSALASMTLFPSLRYSTMYIRASLDSSKPMQLLLHITFLLPIFILTLFMNPVKRHFVEGRYDFITPSRFEAARILLIVIWASLRLLTAKAHFQSFLDSPFRKLQLLQKETGYIKSNDLQKLIIQYAQYFCAAALQYFLPVFLTLVVSLILKNLGDIDFFGTYNPMTQTEPKEMPAEIIDSNSLASLRVLLNFNAQKAFWSYCLVNLLIINVALTAFGTIYSYNFVQAN
jgi:hypothetical protein